MRALASTPRHSPVPVYSYSQSVTEIDDEMAALPEFAFLKKTPSRPAYRPLPTVERIDRGPISALKFGDGPPRVVFLHGGGQNAHTWDTVIVGLGEPALAVDLPGHGRSAWREDGDYGPKLNAVAVGPSCVNSRRMPTSSSGCRWAV